MRESSRHTWISAYQRGNQTTESLGVRQKAQTSAGDIVMGVCYRLPHQEEAVHDAFKQLEEVSDVQEAGPGPQGDFSRLDIYWKNNTAVCKWSRRFVECTDGSSFLTHVINKLDLTLPVRKNWVGMWRLSSFVCSLHNKEEFRILQGRDKTTNRITTLDFRRADVSGRRPAGSSWGGSRESEAD